jgi:hypothetical protein
MNRRQFLGAALTSGTASRVVAAGSRAAGEGPGFFRTAQRHGRWWFLTPEDKAFFSLGLNHIDSAALRYPEVGDLWRRKYGNSMERWLKEMVRPDLLAWGFNSVGWVQEVVTRGLTNHRHSPSFTFEEYQWLDLPYCHLLPFADFHQWEVETRHPDLFSRDFEDWCDYVARSQCGRLCEDCKLIGYFYIDCPMWVHVRPGNEWKGPLFDPQKLQTDGGRQQLHELATRYYRVTHDAIRRYDRHHLILGDRYEAMAPVPQEVLSAAGPFVDVFSFQHFGPVAKIRADLAHFAELTGKPILLADSAGTIKLPDGTLRTDPAKYRDTLAALREIPACVGLHLCGAYLRNRARNRGPRGPDESPDRDTIAGITAANREIRDWVDDWAAGEP